MDPRNGSPPSIGDLRQKWQEIPIGDGRRLTSDLVRLPEDQLRSVFEWNIKHRGTAQEGSWYLTLYKDAFRGKRILEIGSGSGLDGIEFLKHGALWTFSDIVGTNLELVRRFVEMEGLASNASYFTIDAYDSFSRLTKEFDVIWANGSLINLSFQDARTESLSILSSCLKPGGRWIELTYPRQRWVREGSVPFSQWGEMTDGPGTPWMEWYDTDRLLERMYPARLRKIFTCDFGNGAFNWHDLELTAPFEAGDIRPLQPRQQLPLGQAQAMNDGVVSADDTSLSLTTDARLWAYSAFVPYETGATGTVTAHVSCSVVAGAVGIAFADRDLQFVGPEAVADEGSSGVLAVRSASPEHITGLIMRNASGHGQSRAVVSNVEISCAD